MFCLVFMKKARLLLPSTERRLRLGKQKYGESLQENWGVNLLIRMRILFEHQKRALMKFQTPFLLCKAYCLFPFKVQTGCTGRTRNRISYKTLSAQSLS